MTKFNKEYQVKEVAKMTGISQEKVSTVYNALVEVLSAGLKEGKVVLSKFGTFEKAARAERTCRNPQNGTVMTVPAHNAVKFRPVEALKKLVNE